MAQPGVEVDLKEFDALLRGLEKKASPEQLGRALGQGGLVLERFIKEKTPVLTGTLRASYFTHLIETAAGLVVVIVGSLIPYSIFVEYGTRFQRAQPHVRPSVDEARPQIIRVVAAAIKELVSK